MKKCVGVFVLMVAVCNICFGQLKLSKLPFVSVWDTGSYCVGVELLDGAGADHLFKPPYVFDADTLNMGYGNRGSLLADAQGGVVITGADIYVQDSNGARYIEANTAAGSVEVTETSVFGVDDGIGDTVLNINNAMHRYCIGEPAAGMILNSAAETDTITGTVNIPSLATGSKSGVSVDADGNLVAISTNGIVAAYDSVHLTASSVGFLTYTVPSGQAHTYTVGGYMTTSSSTDRFEVTWTDESSSVPVSVYAASALTSVAGSGSTTTGVTGRYQYAPLTIRCRAGSSITVNVSFEGSGNCDAGAWIEQMR